MNLQLDWRSVAPLSALVAASTLFAGDINVNGVEAAAIEMPHTAALLRRPDGVTTPNQLIPLHVLSEDPFTGIERNEYAFEAFLDTGTSGVLLSRELYEFIGVQQQLDSNDNPVSFFDVTIDGEKEFHVSENLFISIGPMPLTSEPEYNDLPGINSVFTAPTPIRSQLAVDYVPEGTFGAAPRNVVGMPAINGHAFKVDSTLYNYLDPESEEAPGLLTTIHDANDPTLPQADHTIRLSFADFSEYTRVSPDEPTVEGPTLAFNPFIGANPLDPTPGPDAPPGVTIRRDNAADPSSPFSSTGSWLLDTGAQVSFMSSEQAAALNVELIDLLGIPVLVDATTGELVDGQFQVLISGADPSSFGLIAGFRLDELVLPSLEGNITYHDVPILVVDVMLEDADGNVFTLDGDIGMNLFLPSMSAEGENARSSLFDYMVFDEPNKELRLTLTVPEPASLCAIAIGAGMMLRRRRSL